MILLSGIGEREVHYVIARLHKGMSIKPASQWAGRDQMLAQVEKSTLRLVADQEFVARCIRTASIVQDGVDYPAAMARLAIELAVVTALMDIAETGSNSMTTTKMLPDKGD